jgi:hypothetical protein
MAILRHSRIALTMKVYTQVPDKTTRDALKRLSDLLGGMARTLSRPGTGYQLPASSDRSQKPACSAAWR